MSGAGGLDVTTEGRLEVLSVLLRFQLFSDTRSEKGGFEAGCRISAGSVHLRIPVAGHLELPSVCSGILNQFHRAYMRLFQIIIIEQQLCLNSILL